MKAERRVCLGISYLSYDTCKILNAEKTSKKAAKTQSDSHFIDSN